MPWESHCDALQQIARSFYQTYRLIGIVKLKFSVRSFEDSDGNDVIDVYVSPQDADSASALAANTGSPNHIQFLETMVPAPLLGYQFVLKITPRNADDVDISVIEAAPFVTCGI